MPTKVIELFYNLFYWLNVICCFSFVSCDLIIRLLSVLVISHEQIKKDENSF